MKVCSYVKDVDGSSYHRVFMPNQTIDADVQTVNNIGERHLEWCDILHYSRHTMISPRFLDQMRAKYGFKIIVDTDDWWEVGKDHPKYKWWAKSNIGLQIREHMMMADAVTCTHDNLKSIVPNSNVFVIPNALPYGEGQFAYREQQTSNKVRLLYASTIMNYSNTSLIAGAMKKLVGLPIEVVITGHHDSPLFEILVNNLTAGGSIPHRFIKWLPAQEYMTGYEGDIMILPSKSTEFNRYKSNLKVLEAAALRTPVLVSESDPYLGLPVNYFSGEKQFLDQIMALIEDVNYRKECGDKLYDFCKKNYDLSLYKEKRLETYALVQRGDSHNGSSGVTENDKQYSGTAI